MDNKKRKLEENGTLELTRQDVRKLIENFTKEELMDILQEAAVCHEDTLEEVRKVADKDPANRKLFVRGLGWDTDSDMLKDAFSQYGEIGEAMVIIDKNTGKSKGYGFVTYMHMDGANRALKEPSKKIDGRMTVCQLASTGPVSTHTFLDNSARKIYVGSVPADVDADKLINLFSKYGEIEEGPLGFDKKTKKSRGFALFVYKSVEAAQLALEEPVKTIDGHQLYCKLALDSQKQKLGGALQGQSNGVDLALLQAGNAVGAASTAYQNALAGALSVNPALSFALHPGLNANHSLASLNASLSPSVVQQLALGSSLGHTLNSPLRSSLNPSLSASFNASLAHGGSHSLSHLGHLPSSLSAASLGVHGLGAYGLALGGPQSAYASALGASLYGVPTGSQTAVLQGGGSHLSLSPLRNSRLARAAESRLQSLSSYYST